MKEAFKLTACVFGIGFGFGVGTTTFDHLFGKKSDDRKGLESALQDIVTGEQAMDLLKAISTPEFLKDMSTIAAFHAKHKDRAGEEFVKQYNISSSCDINTARRNVEMIYYRAQVAHQLGMISDDALQMVMEPGSVAAFLNMVQPLSEQKPNPKKNILEQRAFWEAYSQK